MDMMIEHMSRWLTAVKADNSNRSLREKVIANRPADVVDACWTTTGVKIVEPQTLNGPGQCSALFPVGLSPELVAGSPINVDIIKCQLKPIDMNDYKVSFSTQQRAQLQAIFPNGVCDWSKPGVNYGPNVTWPSFGPSPDNLVFDVTHP